MKKPYHKPDTVVLELKERLMLELPVSNSFVDDEAAKSHDFDFDDLDEGDMSHDLWGTGDY